jgi:hypothetical protein
VKKKMKKLVLAKETVRNLEEPVFGKVAAGTGPTYGYQCYSWGCVTTNGPYECANACIGDGPP